MGTNSSAVVSVWTYDSVGRNWLVYEPANLAPSSISSLPSILPGVGYWVKMTKGATLQVAGIPWAGVTTLRTGWNLVGFPGLNVGPEGKTDLASVFRGQFSSVPIIWTFQGGVSQRFVGYDTLSVPPLADLTGIVPGQGYWVYSLANLSLTPVPQIALAPDSDASPLQPQVIFTTNDLSNFRGTNAGLYLNQIVRLAGPEDAAYDLNHNGILDSPYTQDTVFFPSGLNQQNFSLANNGTGLMDWWIDSFVPWLTVSPSAGSASTEMDTVQMTVDRSGWLPGYYTNSFIIHAGSVAKTVIAILQVPTVAGDYHGYATIQTVNGKPISIAAVDLNLSLFMESDDPAETHFRAVIDREKALLFPTDVFMNGVFYQGLSFSATTSFPMAATDHNAPPYATFANPNPANLQGGLLNIGGQLMLPDADKNTNGVLDAQNIFPFAIRREVTLLGARTTADHLEGTYVEAILGALPNNQRIYMTGTFTLDRDTLTPSTKSIYNGQTNATVIIGGSATTSYTNTLNVAAGVQIQGATVNMNFNYGDYSQLDVVLYGPHGQFYDFGTNVAGLSSFSVTNFNNTLGNGNWQLVVNWNRNTIRGYFNGWGLKLAGLAYYDVTGTVVTSVGGTNVPVSGANIVLVGSNILPQSNTSTNGSFGFSSLTENEYTLSVSAPGFYPTNQTFNIDAANLSLNPIILTPVIASAPVVTAAPFIGQAPLYVTFTPILPASVVASLGSNIVATWAFGDGSVMPATNAVSVAHFYTNGGSFQAGVTFTGSAGSTSLSAGYVTALASSPNSASVSNTAYYVFGGGFVGSFASPLNDGNIIETTPISISNQTYYAVYQESKRDSATFDIDRWPYASGLTPFNANGEDTQFFVQAVTWKPNGLSYYDVHGAVPVPVSQQFRMVCTMGGYVFPPETVPWSDQTAQVGTFSLQAGRVEP